ncbi:MAG TPA: proton-conducting transporter membrane subunit, partial [Acidimicrobiales bacterium]|nr:proton-conducting transporter membrane subunit [Acidimicrobiales bacterium]
TFIVGWLAIAGVPPFAGFWSKDDILLAAWDKSVALWAVGLVTALLTAYYMSRQVFLVFYGEERWRAVPADDRAELTGPEPVGAGAHGAAASGGAGAHGVADPGGHGAGHGGPGEPHESPWTMAGPLVVLAGLAVVAGALNLPFKGFHHLEGWLEPVFGDALHHTDAGGGEKVALALAATAAAAAGIGFAYATFVKARRVDAYEPAVLKRAWGVDALYSALIEAPGRALSAFAAYVVDARVIDGIVNGAGTVVRAGGGVLRRAQTGYVRNYALGVAFGATLLLGWFMVRAGA